MLWGVLYTLAQVKNILWANSFRLKMWHVVYIPSGTGQNLLCVLNSSNQQNQWSKYDSRAFQPPGQKALAFINTDYWIIK
jgi:hypothetical protein